MQYNKIAPEYPVIQWIHRVRWVVDGNGKFWTSSGVAAGMDMDMANAFIQHLFGKEKDNQIATCIEILLREDTDTDAIASNLSIILNNTKK
jgi:transcriptional regulator GlxA family with amidase domain